METLQINRFSPLRLSARHTLRNRVVIPPMASQTACADGRVNSVTLRHYARLAEAGPGLLIVEYTFVHPSGRSEENQLGISDDSHVAGLTRLAGLIHQSGAVAGIQLTHAGGKTTRALTGGRLMAPGAVPVPVKGQVMETPEPMGAAEIRLWRKSFVRAARRAVHAGFDLVEFHSAHGYGLNQWLSPLTNHRSDEYGKDLAGRGRLLREVVRAVRANHPNLLLSVRLPGQDFLESGLRISDTIEVARSLAAQGVNIIHVSSGIGGWRRPATRDGGGEGYLVEEAAAVQAQVSVPVIGVGGIKSAAYIDGGLRAGTFALAAVGRAILEDPRRWSDANLRLDRPLVGGASA